MKRKLFAIALILVAVMMLTSFNIQAEAVAPSEQNSNSATSILTPSDILIPGTDEGEEAKDGKITLEFLKQMSSWEELVNTTIDGGYATISKEDRYCIRLIKLINQPLYPPIYHDVKYIDYSIRVMVNEINYYSLIKKYQAIMDIYNASNELQLIWKTEIYEEDESVSVDVMSTNAIDLNRPATAIGQRVILKNGAKYWESSWNDGSGRHGTVTDDNPYIPKDSIVIVNGVAYLDEVRTSVVESYYKPYNKLKDQEVEIEIWQHRMLHICTETTDLGWVYPENVVRL